MPSYWVEEAHEIVNTETHETVCLISEPFEYDMGEYDGPGDVFRAFVRSHEYGRCAGKVYVNDGQPVGWIFEKRDRYEDTGDPFLHVTWVTLMSGPTVVRRERQLVSV